MKKTVQNNIGINTIDNDTWRATSKLAEKIICAKKKDERLEKK